MILRRFPLPERDGMPEHARDRHLERVLFQLDTWRDAQAHVRLSNLHIHIRQALAEADKVNT